MLYNHQNRWISKSSPTVNCSWWSCPLCCEASTRPGPRFTNGFSIAIQTRWKFRSTLTSILIQWSLQNFVHGTTAVLSWHVQIFVAIWWPATELWQGEVSIEFELRAKTVSETGPMAETKQTAFHLHWKRQKSFYVHMCVCFSIKRAMWCYYFFFGYLRLCIEPESYVIRLFWVGFASQHLEILR